MSEPTYSFGRLDGKTAAQILASAPTVPDTIENRYLMRVAEYVNTQDHAGWTLHGRSEGTILWDTPEGGLKWAREEPTNEAQVFTAEELDWLQSLKVGDTVDMHPYNGEPFPHKIDTIADGVIYATSIPEHSEWNFYVLQNNYPEGSRAIRQADGRKLDLDTAGLPQGAYYVTRPTNRHIALQKYHEDRQQLEYVTRGEMRERFPGFLEGQGVLLAALLYRALSPDQVRRMVSILEESHGPAPVDVIKTGVTMFDSVEFDDEAEEDGGQGFIAIDIRDVWPLDRERTEAWLLGYREGF